MRKLWGSARGRISASEESLARNPVHAANARATQQGDLGEAAFLHKAASLGFMVAKPWGNAYAFDFIVGAGQNLWRVQVKSGTYSRKGVYHVGVHRSFNHKTYSYSESDFDFAAVYLIPEETWYILPVREVVGHTTLHFRPQLDPSQDKYGLYREHWPQLSKPDGLTFG
jgi:hypothetical protein